MKKKRFEWAIIGAGPAGLAALGHLLDAGVDPLNIAWIDPLFEVGDLGKFWHSISSNTRVETFFKYLNALSAFRYKERPNHFVIDQLDHQQCCQLKHIVEPLQWISHHLQEKVHCYQTQATRITVAEKSWHIETTMKTIDAAKVILAIGSNEKSLNYPDIESIELKTALNSKLLSKACDKKDKIAVFGSSHSAMIIIRYLIELGIERIINFYLEPIRYAIQFKDWTLYDNTGLKGETAAWVHKNITQHCLPQVERHHSNPEHIAQYLPDCDKAIYAVGFKARQLPITGVNTADYDRHSGIIAPGLFGCGIAFPQMATTPLGHQEINVGLWKFMQDLKKVLPIWQEYGL